MEDKYMVVLTTTINDNEKKFLDNFCTSNQISRSEVVRQMINFLEKDSTFIDFSKKDIKMSPDWLEQSQPKVHNILEGMLFSDASLDWVGRYPRMYFCQTLRHGEYCEYLANLFNIKERLLNRDRYDKRTGKIYQIKEFKTLKSKNLLPYYARWYSNGKKNIPKDFKITSESLLHAYIGDGFLTIDKSGKSGNKICISTNSFQKQDLENIVCPQLNNLNINYGFDKHKENQYVLRIHWGSHKEFFNFIRSLSSRML